MTMTTTPTPPSPTGILTTGRLSVSMPELQHFPGTPQALAQTRRMKAAIAQGNMPVVDFTSLEDRVDVAALETYLQSASQNKA